MRKIAKVFAWVTLSLYLVIAFQNCSKPGSEITAQDSSLSASTEDLQFKYTSQGCTDSTQAFLSQYNGNFVSSNSNSNIVTSMNLNASGSLTLQELRPISQVLQQPVKGGYPPIDPSANCSFLMQAQLIGVYAPGSSTSECQNLFHNNPPTANDRIFYYRVTSVTMNSLYLSEVAASATNSIQCQEFADIVNSNAENQFYAIPITIYSGNSYLFYDPAIDSYSNGLFRAGMHFGE